jgi:beta-phosphoglucomutase-like phosphatase (HAD superfamily)
VLFARYCVAPSPRNFVPRLLQALGKTRHSAERLIAELQQNLQLAMADGSVALDADVVAVLDAARARQCRAGAVSALSADACAALSERLGLPERGLTLVSHEQDVQFGPGPDVWRGLCRTLQVSPLRSFAVVSDQHACRAALLGGLRCVVRPDAYTGFQDFGGADLVVDRLSPAVFDALPAPQHA